MRYLIGIGMDDRSSVTASIGLLRAITICSSRVLTPYLRHSVKGTVHAKGCRQGVRVHSFMAIFRVLLHRQLASVSLWGRRAHSLSESGGMVYRVYRIGPHAHAAELGRVGRATLWLPFLLRSVARCFPLLLHFFRWGSLNETFASSRTFTSPQAISKNHQTSRPLNYPPRFLPRRWWGGHNPKPPFRRSRASMKWYWSASRLGWAENVSR